MGVLLLAGCGGQAAEGSLDGTSWELRLLNGRDLAPGTTITLVFDGATFYGYAGCNAYGRLASEGNGQGDRYVLAEDDRLTFPAVAIADGQCPEPPGVMEQETAYVEALRKAAAFRPMGNQLQILDADGYAILTFGR
jgi:heat shock protein HslJ